MPPRRQGPAPSRRSVWRLLNKALALRAGPGGTALFKITDFGREPADSVKENRPERHPWIPRYFRRGEPVPGL